MKGITQAEIRIRQFTWLTLGLCFVLLYSCPVKKFILLQFGKADPAMTAAAQFRKNLSLQGAKIVYLNRNSSGYNTRRLVRSFNPVIPSLFNSSILTSRYPGQAGLSADRPSTDRKGADHLPLYLQILRLQV
jgi:hypothetical protein